MTTGVIVTVSSPYAVAAVVALPSATHVLTARCGSGLLHSPAVGEIVSRVVPGVWRYRAYVPGFAPVDTELPDTLVRRALYMFLTDALVGEEGDA